MQLQGMHHSNNQQQGSFQTNMSRLQTGDQMINMSSTGVQGSGSRGTNNNTNPGFISQFPNQQQQMSIPGVLSSQTIQDRFPRGLPVTSDGGMPMQQQFKGHVLPTDPN
jgi:hypothetical protein